MAGIRALLKTIDADGSGFVTVQECRDYLNKPMDEAREGVELLLKIAGEKDGKLAVNDFAK